MKACSDVKSCSFRSCCARLPSLNAFGGFLSAGSVMWQRLWAIGIIHGCLKGGCLTLARGGQDRITCQVCLRMLVSIRQLSFINTIQTRAQDPGSKPRNVGVVSFYCGKLVRRRVILRTAVLRMDFFSGSEFPEKSGKAKTS